MIHMKLVKFPVTGRNARDTRDIMLMCGVGVGEQDTKTVQLISRWKKMLFI